jgi:telomerase reverse transcriptase
MFYDTTLNSAATVLKSLYDAFCETATKMWAYIRCLPKQKRPAASLVTRMCTLPGLAKVYHLISISLGTIVKVMDVSFSLLTSKSRRLRYDNYACSIRKGQVLL